MTDETVAVADEEGPPSAGVAAGLLLLLDARWVHRRVETIDVLSTELSRRTVSVDFTVPPVFRETLAIAEGEFVVPIATLAKAPLRHFDLRDERKGAVPVLGQHDNGRIAAEILIEFAQIALEEAEMSPPKDRLLADLRTIATSGPEEADATLAGLYRAAHDGDHEARTVLDDDVTALLLSTVSADFILFAVLESVAHRRILKYSYDQPLGDRRPYGLRMLQGLGLSPLSFEIDAPAAVGSLSYHAEIVIPEELRLTFAVLVDTETGQALADADADSDRGALHAPEVERLAQPELLVAVGAERAGFVTVAVCVAFVISCALWAGATILEPDPAEAGPSVAILFAGSALFSGALTQRGEHRLVGAFFAPLRALLGCVAVLALIAATVLALGASSRTINTVWTVAAIIATLLTGLLVIAWWKARGRQVSPPNPD